ncbi:MAG: EutN/CcmL family microcompartment protein [Candidatus Atribacteria bacterium]|nr:EutN/CcmL family microcompartment protein [Candidatus Atribacteria bacterium]
MILARVIGQVVSTMKLRALRGYKLLLVQPIDAGEKPKGKSLLVIDTVQAGMGEVVLVMDEGNSARSVLEDASAPIRSIIVGIVDEIQIGGREEK